MRPKLVIALIGGGRVGTAIALGLKRAGHRVVSVRDTDPAAERRARRLLLPHTPTPSPGSPSPDVFLVATPDSRIAAAWSSLVPGLRRGQSVVHFSGALSSRVFRNAERFGIAALSMHPVMTFTREAPVSSFADVHFALEGGPKALALGRRLVRELGGKSFIIAADDKPVFHVSCVFVSNLLDVTIDAGVETCRLVGLEPGTAFRVLEPLITRTLKNIAAQGTVQALTGPVERGDALTVRRHLSALRRHSPELLSLYAELSRRALVLAARKGSLSRSALRAVRSALRE